jgi:CRP/FNR family transcriptional regulator, cyclic AMP receptor protein
MKLTALRRHPLFSGLPLEHFERLSTYASTRAYSRGATIFTKGDPGASLFVVCSGIIRIAVSSPDGRNAVYNLIGEGEIFGDIALLDGQTRTADATAMTICELVLIDRHDFVGLLESQPESALKLIEMLCASAENLAAGRGPVVPRFARAPGQAAASPRRWRGESCGGDHKISMTQRELGQMIGMSRESTNRQLREWEERGISAAALRSWRRRR